MENEQAYKQEFAQLLKQKNSDKPLPVKLPEFPKLTFPSEIQKEWETTP